MQLNGLNKTITKFHIHLFTVYSERLWRDTDKSSCYCLQHVGHSIKENQHS